MTAGLLLAAGMLLEISILMVMLSWVLAYRVNRWANIVVGALTILSIIVNGQNDLDDFFFSAVEIVTLFIIILYAWQWPKIDV